MKDEILLRDEIEIVTTPEMDEYALSGVALGSHDDSAGGEPYQRQSGVCEASMASFEAEMGVDVLSTSQASQRTFGADDDYDKMFLLSLLPSFRQIPEHMKLHVRIQIQQILASAFHANGHHAG